MQHSWRVDNDKLTFIVCTHPDMLTSLYAQTLRRGISPGYQDAPDRMIGDVNLFLSCKDSSGLERIVVEAGCINERDIDDAVVQ